MSYSDTKPVTLATVKTVRFPGATLEQALASEPGFKSVNLTEEGLESLCLEMNKTSIGEIPRKFFENFGGLSVRFIAGGTIFVCDDRKYVLAMYYVGHDRFIRPVVLSTKNTKYYYFLTIKEG